MNETLQSTRISPAWGQPLGLWDRIMTLGAWSLAGALFLTVGWLAMEPDDPLGPISLLARHDSLMMLLQVAALAAVTGGLASVMAGRRLADIGVFAAALGLALVSLKGATAEYFVIQGVDQSSSFERVLALKFAGESVAWFTTMIVAAAASALVLRWCHRWPDQLDSVKSGGQRTAPASTSQSHRSAGRKNRPAPMNLPQKMNAALPAAWDIPWLRTHLRSASTLGATKTRQGWKHTLIAVGVGLIASALLSTGLSSRSIQQGQVCFSVAASVFLGVNVAFRFAPVRSPLWSILSVVLLAVVGYLWAALQPMPATGPPTIPSSHFLRILPIQFIAVGTASAVATFWYLYLPLPPVGESESHRAGKAKSKGHHR